MEERSYLILRSGPKGRVSKDVRALIQNSLVPDSNSFTSSRFSPKRQSYDATRSPDAGDKKIAKRRKRLHPARNDFA